MLEDWPLLGIGAAILPKSKISAAKGLAHPLVDGAGAPLRIEFEISWSIQTETKTHLKEFVAYLKSAVPWMADRMMLEAGL